MRYKNITRYELYCLDKIKEDKKKTMMGPITFTYLPKDMFLKM